MRLRGLLLGTLLTTAAVTAGSQQQSPPPSVQFTTTGRLEGCTISRYLGVVTAAPRIGGDRAPSQKEFPETYAAAMLALRDQAEKLGANWVIKLEFTIVYGYDRDGPATGHFPQRLAAVGTAVRATCP